MTHPYTTRLSAPPSGAPHPLRRVIGLFAAILFLAAAAADARWERIPEAVALLDGAEPRAGALELDLPTVTQNGSSVPLTVRFPESRGENETVEALYIFAPGNPSPEVAEFSLTPALGNGELSTRIRLNQSQPVVALARTRSGDWLAGTREVRVTVSGCITANQDNDANAMQPRARASQRVRTGQLVDVRTLIRHPMETGLRERDDGTVVPERIIQSFEARRNGETILSARFHRAVSANPYLLFHVDPRTTGGTLELTWTEDTGESASATVEVPSAP